MARIRRFQQDSVGNARVHPTEVDCGWRAIHNDEHGALLLQLSTYGSDSRKSDAKVSQTLQLDRAMAGELMGIIRQVFGE